MSSEEATKLIHGLGESSNTQELTLRERDFSFLIWTYTEMSGRYFTRIDHFPPFIRRFGTEDILNKIRRGERYIFQGEQVLEEVVDPPDPILNLATDLAIEQLIQIIRRGKHIRKVSMTTRNNVEKRDVLAKIEAALKMEKMVGNKKRFERVVSIDVSTFKSDNEVREELAGQLGFQTITDQKYLVLLMDGDSDQKINPWEAGFSKYSKKDVVVFITTESAAVRRSEYVARADEEMEIRTEDHLLPWVLFCRNVGSDLVGSSSGIRRIAVQIVEVCRRYLRINVMVGRLLKNVQDVEIWERTLQILRSTSGIIVNAFILFWESLDSIKKDCLNFCLWISRDTIADLTFKWVRFGFLETTQAAEDFLEELSSFSFIRKHDKFSEIHFCEEIYRTLKRLNPPPVIMKSKSHEEDPWYRAVVIDSKRYRLPQYPNCPILRVLVLKNNSNLTEIPQLFFQQMPVLRTLDLCQTSLRNLPSSVINLTELKVLKLSNCKLIKGFPIEIGQLDNLENVHLDGTQIANLPPSPNWPRILQLLLQNNPHLTELPPLFFDHMPLLKNLDLSSTSIKGLPHSFYKLMELRWLSLSGSKLFVDLLPEIGHLKNIENIRLDGTRIEDLPPSPNWPLLTVLLLQENSHLLELPSGFFDHMQLLEELNLSSTSIKELPTSFSKLMNLRRLYLSDCELFMKLPPDLGALSFLNKLHLDGTYFLHLPEVVKELTNVESLILCFYGSPRDTSSTIIPTGVISNLKSLSTLIIHVNPDDKRWYENLRIILPEIAGLEKLSVLKLYIPEVKLQEELLSTCKDRLEQFEFTVGHQMQRRIISRAPPAIAAKLREGNKILKYVNGVDIPQEISVALLEAHTFFLDRHSTIKDLSAFGLQNLQKLHVCVLGECNEMHTIVDGRHSFLRCALEFLGVFYMKNLESISKEVCTVLFSTLKSLALHNCPKLKTIFTLDFINNLNGLEEIVIEDCPEVTTLITHESSKLKGILYLHKLRKVSLLYLPKLESIFGGLRIGPNLTKIGFYYCPKLESLSSMELRSKELKVIKGEATWWGRLNWSQEEWKQNEVDHLKKIFSRIDEERDILTQLTMDEDEECDILTQPTMDEDEECDVLTQPTMDEDEESDILIQLTMDEDDIVKQGIR